jgi:L-asparaginase II
MLAHPEMLGSTKDGVDGAAMRATPHRLLSLSAPEGLRGMAILAGQRQPSVATAASGLVIKIEDGDGLLRAGDATAVEGLRQAGLLDPAALRALARYHRPVDTDPHGRIVAEAAARFELAPVGELIV